MAHLSEASGARARADVELVVRQRGSKPRKYDVPEAGFLIGSVAGCDLRVAGTGLPPVICMISRGEQSAELRRLAPTYPVLINGSAKGKGGLQHGDRITVSDVEIEVHVQEPIAPAMPAVPKPQAAPIQEPLKVSVVTAPAVASVSNAEAELTRRQQALAENEAQLNTFAEELAREKQELQGLRQAANGKELKLDQERQALAAQVSRQKQELQDLRQAASDKELKLDRERQALVTQVSRQQQELQDLRQAVNDKELKLNQERQALATRADQVSRQQQELTALGKQLADVRAQVHGRYKAERDRLAKLQASLKAGAAKVQERHRAVIARERGPAAEQAALDAARAEVLALRKEQEDLYRQKRDRLAWLQQKVRRAARRVRAGREQLDENRRQLQGALDGCKKYRADIENAALELTRREEVVAESERALEERAREQQAELDARIAACQDKEKQVAREQDATARTARQLQEDLVRYQRQLAAVNEKEQHIEERAAELERRGVSLHTDTRELEEQARQLEQWQASVREEAEQLAKQKQAQDAVATDLQKRSTELDGQQGQLTSLRTRLERGREVLNQEEQEFAAVRDHQQQETEEVQRQIDADRLELQSRETLLLQKEQALQAQEDELRRRSEDLAEQEKAQAQETALLSQRTAGVTEQQRRLDLKAAEQQQAQARRADELARVHDELVAREARWQKNAERLKEAGRMVSSARKLLAEDQRRLELIRQDASREQARQREEQRATQEQLAGVARSLPGLQKQAQSNLEQLTQARKRLREQLAEIHNYARSARTDLESVRDQVHAEIEQVRRQETALHRARDEHNMAVAEFRQQLGAESEVPQAIPVALPALPHGDDVPLASDVIPAAPEAVPVDQNGPAEMHAWYKAKLRALIEGPAEGKRQADAKSGSRPDILSITGNIHPADRKLGDLLLSLDLIEQEALDAVLVEAHKQRRSLRQALLSGGCLTLYQLALIEAGNIEALTLGPVFPVDRLRSSQRETVYRVYDPRRQTHALLRHLAEADVQAGRASEFRESFGRAVTLRHPNLAATREVLEIHGRPAVLQESLTGLTAADWPELINVPGVWYRLVCQAVLGLKTAHESGLVHGHLDASRILLTREGTLKLSGFGEPPWLAGDESTSVAADTQADLRALGELATAWAGALTPRRGTRGRAGTSAIRDIVAHLGGDESVEQFTSAAELLDALEQVGDKLPANAAAWDRLVQHVKENAVESTVMRKSA